ncbi:MAG: glutathione S-transferase family protein [Alphaproteobacteria bacterium]|nr:glutathione S-transferase family protein [Alphaproteobacteria bacterium]
MKLYEFSLAPNPRRVRMFLAEKDITIPSVQVNTREREQFADDFKKVSPRSLVPVLELDDGTCIAESVAICRYIEEIQPEPPLFGRDAKEKALVEMWNRHAEVDGFGAVGDMVRNSAPLFEGRGLAGLPGGEPQIPALVERGQRTVDRFMHYSNRHLADHQFLAGDQFSIADITAFIAVEFGQRANYAVPEDCDHVKRWHAEIAARPSATA